MLEKKNIFQESAKNAKGKNIQFFKYGPKSNWKDYLPEEIHRDLTNLFKDEMIELGYL